MDAAARITSFLSPRLQPVIKALRQAVPVTQAKAASSPSYGERAVAWARDAIRRHGKEIIAGVEQDLRHIEEAGGLDVCCMFVVSSRRHTGQHSISEVPVLAGYTDLLDGKLATTVLAPRRLCLRWRAQPAVQQWPVMSVLQ